MTPVPVSAEDVRRGHAWWKCPHCGAGGERISRTRVAIRQARAHFRTDHPLRRFRPEHQHA